MMEIKRAFPLGDQWLYYKIYTGFKTSDKILKSVIKPCTEQLILDKIITRWHFIRYNDPRYHLRVRFNFNDVKALSTIATLLLPHFAKYVEDDLVWKIQTDTYERELERYGTGTILNFEDFSFHDSWSTIEMLTALPLENGEELRWLFALRAVDRLLTGFDLNLSDKRLFCQEQKTSFCSEFNLNPQKDHFNTMYLEKRRMIERILEGYPPDHESELIFQILDIKDHRISPVLNDLVLRHRDGKLEVSLKDLAKSYIHMSINRIFRTKNRATEMVLYEFLHRYYNSVIHRNAQI
jgi:thiopeptide-type bacteriocin biosynthesis protein